MLGQSSTRRPFLAMLGQSSTRRPFLAMLGRGLALLVACLVGGLLNPLEVRAGVVIASGDEWPLSNRAFSQNPTSTTAFAANLATFIGGKNYLIYENAGATRPYGTSFQSLLRDLGKKVTVNPPDPFSAELLARFDAVFLSGTRGSGEANAAILNEYVQSGGSVYVSLGTANFGGPAAEAAAWNHFLNSWGLNAESVWFPDPLVLDIPTATGKHPLQLDVSDLSWGFGQEITVLDPEDPFTDIAVIGMFRRPFKDRGMIGATVVFP